MSICLNMEICTGCGLCVEVCPPQAIHLMASKAVIEPELCLVCGACIEACVVGAITMVEPTALMRSAEVQVPTRAHVVQNTQKIQRGLALWKGIAATLIEHQVVPRLMDAFIAALDRGLSRPKPAPARMACRDMEQSPSFGGSVQDSEGRGRRRRHQRRGDHNR